MTQKPPEKLVPALLQSIDPRQITDAQVRQTVEVLEKVQDFGEKQNAL